MSATFRTRPLMRSALLAGGSNGSSRMTQSIIRSAWAPSSSRSASSASSAMRQQKRSQDVLAKKARSSYEAPSSLAQMQAAADVNWGGNRAHNLLDFLLPRTFVPLPLSKAPRGISDFFEYYWARVRSRVMDAFAVFAIKMGSKPSYLKKARFVAKRSSIVPTARALHRTMSEALASGDKATLQKVCATQLYLDYCRAIDSRPRGKRYGWEVVRYTRPLRFPRVVDHKLAIFGEAAAGAPGIRQAVVAISSRQRRVQYDDTRGGAVVPGSEREMDVVEYVVINCTVDMHTYRQSDWRVWGTLGETSLEQLRDDMALMKRAQEEEMENMKQKRKERLNVLRRTGQ